MHCFEKVINSTQIERLFQLNTRNIATHNGTMIFVVISPIELMQL